MNSDFINGLFLRRRDALKALAGLSAAEITGNSQAQESQPNQKTNANELNFNDPHDNLYAFGKI